MFRKEILKEYIEYHKREEELQKIDLHIVFMFFSITLSQGQKS